MRSGTRWSRPRSAAASDGGPTSPPGLAAVSLAAGIAFGISAQQAQDTLRDGTSRSQEQVQQIYDSASARSTAANGFYAAAGVCGAAAIALFFLEPGFGAPAEGR